MAFPNLLAERAGAQLKGCAGMTAKSGEAQNGQSRAKLSSTRALARVESMGRRRKA
jgi:hypothetical protein